MVLEVQMWIILSISKSIFKEPEIIKLSMNYRSTECIVGASNEVLKHNKFDAVGSRLEYNSSSLILLSSEFKRFGLFIRFVKD